jgi:predicted phosphodiesterase
MKYAILGDIHANLEALTAVLKDANEQGIDKFISTGDLVGYGANPSECLDMLAQIKCEIVQGNHDFYAASQSAVTNFTPSAARTVIWTREQLSSEHRDFLSKLPLVKTIANVTLCHSSLWKPAAWNYVRDEEAASRSFKKQPTPLCVIGHTHKPMIFERNETLHMHPHDSFSFLNGHKYIINPGSVGQPRDNNPLTGYTVLDLQANSVQLRRLPYDIETAQAKIRAAGLPEKNAIRLATGQ